MNFDPEEILASLGPGDYTRYLVAADELLLAGKKRLAASALDRAFSLRPDDSGIARQRAAILDELAIAVHGLRFRYVPAGTFMMGSLDGDPDERPVHARRLSEYWISDVPISWDDYCRLLGYEPPPSGWPKDEELDREETFNLNERNKVRLQYCEDETQGARDWHAHAGYDEMGTVQRRNAASPRRYSTKPMVGVSIAEANLLASELTADDVTYALPTEAEWERAARGGLAGARYSWGDDPPSPANCDYGRMGEFRLGAPRLLPPNGYGIYGMCGGVAEWTSDRYDALAYRRAMAGEAPDESASEYVLRGGAFTDCESAVTVSFRSSRRSEGWRDMSPNIGFRLVRRSTA